MSDDHTRKIASAIETHFEKLAYDLDEIASQYDLDSEEMLTEINAIRFEGSDFFNYYGDWMQATWEKKAS